MFGNVRVLVVSCTAVLLAGAGSAWAQAEGVIRGRIVAAADGSALAGAAVALTPAAAGEPLHTSASADGSFVLTRVRPGEYVLSATADGFGRRELRLALEPREIRTLSVALDVAPLALNVNVAADASLVGTHSPSSTVLTRDRIEMLPAAQRTNLPDALVTSAPGMIRGHDDLVHIRGHEVALNPLINGVSFWENPHSIFSSGFSPEAIDTANVMTGGFSAEYGNRFGGVVDIVTKSGFGLRDQGTAVLNAGSAGRRSAAGEFGGSGGRFGYYLLGSLFESDRFLSPPDPDAIHDHARGAHGLLQLDWSGSGGALRALVMGSGANIEIPQTPLDVELRPLAAAGQRTRQQTAILGWSYGRSDTLLSASAYQRWSRLELAPAAGPLTARAALERDLLTAGGKGDVMHTAGRHAVKAGVDLVRLQPRERLAYDYAGFRELTHLLELPHIHVSGQNIAFTGREGGGQASAYVQDSIQISDRVTIDIGARADRYDLAVTAAHLSPRANLAVRAAGGAVVHASYNRFFVPPPIEGVLSSSAGLTRFIQEIGRGLPPLEPTIEDQVELGVTAPLRALRIGATGYFRASDNPVHTTVWPDSRVYSYASFDRARAYGLELKGEAPGLARHGITAYANYALGRVYFYNPVTGGFVTEADHLAVRNRFPGPMDQTHTFTAGATYLHQPSGLRFGSSFEYGSGTAIGHGEDEHDDGEAEADHSHAAAAGDAVRVPGHFTANLSAGIDLLRRADRGARLTLQVDVENVANDVYLVAQESHFSPRQFSVPRLASVTMKVRF